MAIGRRSVRKPKREVEWDGHWYKVRSDKIDIPDLQSMGRFSALKWLIRETYPRGHSRPNPLAGIGGAIGLGVKT